MHYNPTLCAQWLVGERGAMGVGVDAVLVVSGKLGEAGVGEVEEERGGWDVRTMGRTREDAVVMT